MAGDENKPEGDAAEALPHDGEQDTDALATLSWRLAFNSLVGKWHLLYRVRAGDIKPPPGYETVDLEREMFLLSAHAINTLSLLTDDEASKDFYESHADFLLGLLRGRIPDFIKTAASDGAKKSGKTKSGRPTSVNPGQARPLAIADAIAFLAVEERLIPLHAPAATISKLFGISDKKFSDLREVYKDKEFASIYKNDKSSGQQKRYIYNTNLQVSRLRDIFNHIAVERRADAAMKMLESAARRFRAHQRPRQNKKATKLRGYEEPPPKVATFRGTEK